MRVRYFGSGLFHKTLLFVCFFFPSQVWAQSINLGDLTSDGTLSANRIPNFTNAGVRGGIPDTRDQGKWPTWTGTGTPIPSSPSASQIQSAIDAASVAPRAAGQQGWIVQVPAGISNWDYGVGVSLKNNVVLRGQGRSTRFNGRSRRGTGAVDTCPNGPNNSVHSPNLTYGCGHVRARGDMGPRVNVTNSQLPRGQRDFAVNTSNLSTLNLAVGNWAHVVNLSVSGSGGCFANLMPNTDPNLKPIFSLIGKVESILPNTPTSGQTTIRLDTGLALDWTPGVPCGTQIQRLDPIENFGVEDLAVGPNFPIEHKRTTEYLSTYSAVNFWFKNVLVEDGDQVNVNMKYSAFGTVTSSEIGRILCADESTTNDGSIWNLSSTYHVADITNGCSNYSIELDPALGDLLFVNNTFRRGNTEIRFYYGNYRIVYAHNYQTDFQARASNPGEADGIKVHGLYPHDLLIEGNEYQSSAYQSDKFWGPNGPVVLYRNRFEHTGGERGGIFWRDIGPTQSPNAQPNFVVIGNIAWAYFRNQFCDYNTGNCAALDYVNNGANPGHYYAYNFSRDPAGPGNASKGFILANASSTVCRGSSCLGGTIEEGANSAPARWNVSSLQLPASLYATSRQDWEQRTGSVWCQEACSWEAATGIGAFGDNFNGTLCKLPAHIQDDIRRGVSGAQCSPIGGTLDPAPNPPTGLSITGIN